MLFHETELSGAWIIDLERMEDERGFFARTYCAHEFAAHGLATNWVQCNLSFNRARGTLRGLHLQVSPHEEDKLVRCTTGAIYDVIVDMRADSPTYKRHIAVELNEENQRMLYVPRGFAHGFLTLADNTRVFYQMSAFYAPEAARGFHHADPAFAISWPIPVVEISDRDRTYPAFTE